MGYYKDKERNTWFVEVRYKDIYGNSKKKKKRGFKKASEAKEWEIKFLNSLSQEPDITFDSLYDKYIEDLAHHVKETTLYTKRSIFEIHILPYFKDMTLISITPLVIRKWQNEILKRELSEAYTYSIHKQLSAILNYAVKFYNLTSNPCHKSGPIGNLRNHNEMKVWNLDQFKKFLSIIKSEEVKIAFEILFFTGIRIGELLALTFEDINYDENLIQIDKTLSRIKKRDIITKPKTFSSIRKILCSDILMEKIKNFENSILDVEKKSRVIQLKKSALERYLVYYTPRLKLDRLRIHDLRHSHTSFLLHKNVNIVVISKRLGHKNVKTTLDTYSHFLPESIEYLKEILEEMK